MIGIIIAEGIFNPGRGLLSQLQINLGDNYVALSIIWT